MHADGRRGLGRNVALNLLMLSLSFGLVVNNVCFADEPEGDQSPPVEQPYTNPADGNPGPVEDNPGPVDPPSDQPAADNQPVEQPPTGGELKTGTDPNKLMEAPTEQSSNKLSVEPMHQEAVQHWELSKIYFSKWDFDLCETELDLAILYWDNLQVFHRDLCVLSLFRLNLPKALAEFMMTVGLGEPVPRDGQETAQLIQDAMVKHYKKGMEYARRQDWKDSIWELELAVHLVPDDFAVQRSLAFAYANTGDINRAIKHYTETFALAPKDGSSRADLAYFLAQNGKTEEAFKQMKEAVKTSPQAACYHVDLSWMAESRGDLETATKEMQQAVSLAPEQAALWAHLGEVLEQKGQPEEAVNAYSHAVALDPMMVNAKEHLAKLQSHQS